MCDTCGCNITPGNAETEEGRQAVSVLRNLLHENDHVAAHNREHFDSHAVLAINLMSSPGAGKTALLEATLQEVAGRYRCAVLEGDLETENDAERIRRHGVPAIQITTGSACHLDAHMVHEALHRFDLGQIDILFIENVGNLVCPASFDLGQHLNVTLLSVPEGDDKPAKYPVMFRAADLVLLTKTDLLQWLDEFSPERAELALRHLATQAPMLQVSVKEKKTLAPWLRWLDEQRDAHAERIASGRTRVPAIQPDGQALHAHSHHHHP